MFYTCVLCCLRLWRMAAAGRVSFFHTSFCGSLTGVLVCKNACVNFFEGVWRGTGVLDELVAPGRRTCESRGYPKTTYQRVPLPYALFFIWELDTLVSGTFLWSPSPCPFVKPEAAFDLAQITRHIFNGIFIYNEDLLLIIDHNGLEHQHPSEVIPKKHQTTSVSLSYPVLPPPPPAAGQRSPKTGHNTTHQNPIFGRACHSHLGDPPNNRLTPSAALSFTRPSP